MGLLAQCFAENVITFVALCRNEEAAKTLSKVNGYQRIKAFPGLCTQSPPCSIHGDFQLTGWSPSWRDTSWSPELLTKLIKKRFPKVIWEVDSTDSLHFLRDESPNDGGPWGPFSAMARAKHVMSQ
jgi:hypothetical protein